MYKFYYKNVLVIISNYIVLFFLYIGNFIKDNFLVLTE